MSDVPYGDWLDDLDVTPDGEPEPIDLDAGELDALKRVDYHLRHIRAIDQAKTLAAERFQAEFRRIKDLWEERSAQLDRDRAWHEAPCVALHAAILARDPSRKTIKNGLSHGVLKSITPTKPGIEWVDEAAFCDWAEDNATGLVRWEPAPEKNAVKKAFTTALVACPCVAKGLRYSNVSDPNHDGSPDPCDECDDTGEVLRWVTAAGEVVPGIVPVPPATKFTVSVQ